MTVCEALSVRRPKVSSGEMKQRATIPSIRQAFRPLIYVLAFLHAVVLERRKYVVTSQRHHKTLRDEDETLRDEEETKMRRDEMI